MEIKEIFYSYQGEGYNFGKPVIFVRFAGCNYDCSWCFTAGHKVTMADYTKKDISELKQGDIIWGYNENTNKLELTKVTSIMSREAPTWKVDFEGKSFITTSDHPFLVTNKYRLRSWGDANKLNFLISHNKNRWAFRVPYVEKENTDSKDFAAGYLVGYFDGDGNFYQNNTMVSAKIISKNPESLQRLKKFGLLFEVHFRDIMHKGGIKNTITPGIQTNKKTEFEILKSLTNYNKTYDFYRGYLSAMFDAEGSFDGATLKISQSNLINPIKCKLISKALDFLGFKYKQRSEGFALKGGFKETIKFVQKCCPAIIRKIENLYDNISVVALKTAELSKFIGAEITGNIEKVYNITTENHTYLIDDFIVHNCDEALSRRNNKENLKYQINKEEVISQINNLIKATNCYSLIFTGGEPSLYYEDIKALIDHCNSLYDNMWYGCESNGTGKYEFYKLMDFACISPKYGQTKLTNFILSTNNILFKGEMRIVIDQYNEEFKQWVKTMLNIGKSKNLLLYLSPVTTFNGKNMLDWTDTNWSFNIKDTMRIYNELKEDFDLRISLQAHKLVGVR